MLLPGTALLYGYPKAAQVALPIIYRGSGLAAWRFARPSWQLGASNYPSAPHGGVAARRTLASEP